MFFVFTGYFLTCQKTLCDAEKVKKYVARFIEIIFGWALIYLFWNILFTDRSMEHWVSNYITLVVEGIDALNNGPMWYMQNLVLVVLVLYALKKTEVLEREIIIGIMCAAVFDSRLCRAFSCVMFGMYLAQEKKGEKKSVLQNFPVRCVVGVVGLAATILLYRRVMTLSALGMVAARLCSVLSGILFADVALFWDKKFLLNGETQVKISTYGVRKMSTIVYLVHSAIIPVSMALVKRILPIICQWDGTKDTAWSIWVGCVTLAISVTAGIGMMQLSKCRAFAWLKKMY